MSTRRGLCLFIALPPEAPPAPACAEAALLHREYVDGPGELTLLEALRDRLEEAGWTADDARRHTIDLLGWRLTCRDVSAAVAMCCGDGERAKALRHQILIDSLAWVPFPSVFVVAGKARPHICGPGQARVWGISPGSVVVGAKCVERFADQIARRRSLGTPRG